MAGEEWVFENLFLLANDHRESSIGIEEKVVVDTPLPSFDKTFKFFEHTNTFMQPPMDNEEVDHDDIPLRWAIKGKEKVKKRRKKRSL